MAEENKNIISFEGYNPFLQQIKTDKGWRVELDVSQDQYDKIKDIPKLQGKVLKITIEEIKKKRKDFEAL